MQRYPLVMHKGEYPGIQSVHVQDAETEARLTEDGWSLDRPPIPDPPEPGVADPIEGNEQFEDWKTGVESRLSHLEGLAGVVKRPRGRPRKTEA